MPCETDFTELYRRFHRPLLSQVRARVADPETAAELTQEIFLKAYRIRDSYRPEHARSTWLWTIARSTVTDHLRGTLVRVSADPVAEIDDIGASAPSIEAMLSSRERDRAAVRALRRLTRPQRRVFLMRAFRGLPYAEIARRLGLSVSAVKNLSHRARRSLRVSPPL